MQLLTPPQWACPDEGGGRVEEGASAGQHGHWHGRGEEGGSAHGPTAFACLLARWQRVWVCE